jgi:hypothetical protein
MQFADAAEISGTRRTADGYLVADCKVARSGIQLYYGHEIGEGEPNQEFRVYRPEAEVFKKDSLQSYAFRPITLGHPPEGVTADNCNWKKTAVGTVGGDVARDGEYVRVPMLIADAGAISAIADGTRQISMGYVCDLVMQKGTTPDGESYDAIQTNLKMNHAAIVPAGRAGPGARIGDSSARNPQKKDSTMTKTVTIDGKSYEVADDAVAAIAKLQADNKAQADTLKDAVAQIDAAKEVIKTAKADREAAEKAAADAKADAEKAEAAKKATADVQKTAAELIDTMEKAKKAVPDLDVKGKTADAIKKEVVSKKLGDKAVEGKDAAFFDAAFVMLTADAKTGDPVADALRSGPTNVGDEGDKAFTDYKANLSKAWQTPVAKN